MAEKQPQADGGRLTPMKIVSVDARPVDTDTDPSPGPTTDPGLAPPSARSGLAPSTPVASRGRSAAAVETKNDSIDALLENIVETRPAPMKTTPESAGRAAASYHAKHGLHRAQLTPVPEDKVIVERQPQPQPPTLRLDRAQLVKAKAELDATTEDLPLHVLPGRTRAQGARVVIALFGAMGILFVMFIALKIWATKQRTDAMKTDPTASALVSIIPGSQAPSVVTSSANSPVGTPSAVTAAAAPAAEATTTSDVTNGTSDIAPPTTDVAPRAAKNPAPTSTRPAAATTAPGPAATAVTTATAPPPKDDVKRTLP